MVNVLLALSAGDLLTILNSLFFVLGGVTVFMLGMNVMGHNIEKAAGRSIRRLMSRATTNRFVGVGTGAAVTALVNSSSATTVMIVGFVNVGLMNLTQATSVIMGANVGTTVSAFIMALSATDGAQLSIAGLFALVSFIGLIMTIAAKSEKLKQTGSILEGLGLIFIGLNVMSGAVGDLVNSQNIGGSIEDLFRSLGNGKSVLSWEVLVLFLLGAILTAVMQSSGALTAIVISLASANLISMQMAMCIILGTNVGTCFTSVLSSMGASANAKRAALIHLLFNVAGAVVFIFPVWLAGDRIAGFLSSFVSKTQWQIAIFHIAFNVITTILLLPFIKRLVNVSQFLVRDKGMAEESDGLDLRLLKTPSVAVGQVRTQLLKMGEAAFENYKLALSMLLSADTGRSAEFANVESKINAYDKSIVSYLIHLSLEDIGETDEKKISSFFHVCSDFERVGDYAENITEYAERAVEHKLSFSDNARAEILQMDEHITKLYDLATSVFKYGDLSYMEQVEEAENQIDAMNKVMQASHLRRMSEGRCSAETGAIFLQLAVNMERIGDHIHNVANSVQSYGHRAVSINKK